MKPHLRQFEDRGGRGEYEALWLNLLSQLGELDALLDRLSGVDLGASGANLVGVGALSQPVEREGE